MTALTVPELRDKKRDAELKIQEILYKFVKDTNINVQAVNLEPSDYINHKVRIAIKL